VRVAFNIYGHSPVISQFMSSLDADSCTSLSFLVNRTEIENLPPYPLLSCHHSAFFLQFCVANIGLRDVPI